jgi:hypothetical protein
MRDINECAGTVHCILSGFGYEVKILTDYFGTHCSSSLRLNPKLHALLEEGRVCFM